MDYTINPRDPLPHIAHALMAARQTAKERDALFDINYAFVEKHLMMRYREPWRCYHTLEHIGDGAELIVGNWERFSDPIAALMGWLYHDSVFVPGAFGENEETSAQLLEKEMRWRIGRKATARAGAIVRATTDHLLPKTFPGEMNDLALILDIDLSGLGASRESFIETGELIREETGISEEAWIESRAGFAQMLLERPRIYHTDTFAHLEKLARDNLVWARELMEPKQAA